MDVETPTVSLSNYWNWVATPYFLGILIFGIYALFSLQSIQLIPGKTFTQTLAASLMEPKLRAGSTVAAAPAAAAAARGGGRTRRASI